MASANALDMTCQFPRPKAKTPDALCDGGFLNNSLTMTYFHTGCSTIIGAKSFHGPVRDGKGWYQLAMVIRHDLSVLCIAATCMSHVAGASDNPNWKKRSSQSNSVMQVVRIKSLCTTHSVTVTIKVIGTSRTGN